MFPFFFKSSSFTYFPFISLKMLDFSVAYSFNEKPFDLLQNTSDARGKETER